MLCDSVSLFASLIFRMLIWDKIKGAFRVLTWSPAMCFLDIHFSRSAVSDSLWPHELQHARPPCPSPTPGVYSDSCPSSRWCHPPISSSVIPSSSSCPRSLPASGSFPMSQLFPSFRMDWLDLLAAQGTLKSLLQHHSSKSLIFWHSAFFTVQLSHPYMTTGKTIALTRWTIVGKSNVSVF